MAAASRFFFTLTLTLSVCLLPLVYANSEGDALYTFRRSLSDPDNLLQSWDPTLVNPCTWFHITCNQDNRVTRVYHPLNPLSLSLSIHIHIHTYIYIYMYITFVICECWAVKHQHVHKMGVAEMRMLRGMYGHTRKDKIGNEDIQGKVGVAKIEGNMRENRFRWFGHVQRRPTDAPVRKCDYGTEVQGRRGRGRPRKTLEETLRKDLITWI
ncbi:hypothetical protein DVH24_040146 [Malus domestica]|uniref:Leucine-rich repeat-containing N-terminal plant-type domain-containing protein n=1 Tax=Malus domestica TaxID=3750 RepID=A0A498IML8_MALDO|nr:hypothetical protein DVH24_040146 [Malus domestica]